MNLGDTKEPVPNTKRRRPSNTNNHRSNVDQEHDQEVMIMQVIFAAALLRETTRTTHTTIYYNVRSNQESLRESHQLSSTGCMRNKESTNTVNITTDDQEGANDGEDRSTTANISFNIEISFLYGPERSKFP